MTTIREAIEPLDGAGIHLRPASAADGGALATILRDPSVGEWWQVARRRRRCRRAPRRSGARDLADRGGGVVRGLVMSGEETDPMYHHASIDIALVAAGQGRGLGSEAVRTVARWLIDVRRHHRLIIDPSAENERAIAAYAKVGFRTVGVMRAYERWRDGSWHDGLLMDLLADELVDR